MINLTTILANTTTQAIIRAGGVPTPIAVIIILCMAGIIILSVAQIFLSLGWHPVARINAVWASAARKRRRAKFHARMAAKRNRNK